MKKDVVWAFGFLGVEVGDKDGAEKSFSKLLKVYHPDLGGDVEKMKDLNLARELASKYSGIVGSFSRVDWEKIDRENTEKFRQMTEHIYSEVLKRQKDFEDHLSELLEGLKSEITSSHDRNGGFVKLEIFSEDRKTKFLIGISVSFYSTSSTHLSPGDNDAMVYLLTEIYHNNKKHKLSKSSWKTTVDHEDFLEPEKVLPMKKILKAFSDNENKPIKKSDFLLFLKNELSANIDRDTAHIYGKDKLRLTIIRMTYKKIGYWVINGIYSGSGGSRVVPYFTATIDETREGMELLRGVYELLAEGKSDEIVEAFKRGRKKSVE